MNSPYSEYRFKSYLPAVLKTAAFILFSPYALAQNTELPAAFGVENLENGFLPDPYSIEIVAGGNVSAASLGDGCLGYIADAPDFELTYDAGNYPFSISFSAPEDTTLIVNTPNGEWVCDDDSGGNLDPKLEFNNTGSGVYDIWLGTYTEDSVVSGVLYFSEQEGFLPITITEELTDNSDSSTLGENVIYGELAAGDELYSDGAYIDTYSFNATLGQEVIIDYRSENFDTYLIIESPSGETFSNDDYEGNTDRSLLSLIIDEAGEYKVLASSLYEGNIGSYSLILETELSEGVGIDANYTGELSHSDSYRDNGQYIDTYEFFGTPGHSVTLDLNSSDFDTYLILESPNGSIEENDDADSINHSQLEIELSEFGTYQVYVSSYSSEELGEYQLQIIDDGRISQASQSNRDTVDINLDRLYSGSLMTGDTIDSDTFQDRYSFSGSTGDNIRIELDSTEFDTFLSLTLPNGDVIDNDDFESNTQRSVIEVQLPISGRYSLIVTSYNKEEVGDYSLLASLSSENFSQISQNTDTSDVYGIFVGISDYSQLRQIQPGWGDLDNTAEDAIIVRDALMNSAGLNIANSITLLDQEATIENIQDAFSEIGSKVDSDDVFVFFYSGHGGQELRADGPNASDADGYDETLALSNGTIIDDDVSLLFDQIDARVSLIILDSCYSGGFAKDIVSRPGRMGLFSSDEDVPSLVANKFEAGGYLSHFFREAIENGRADDHRDDTINAMELSQYLHERYNSESSSSKAQSNFDTPNFGYQHLVADRGGVTHDSVLFGVR